MDGVWSAILCAQLDDDGAEQRLLVKIVQSAITVMKREVELFAQFAQEPAYFLNLAEDTLKDLEQAQISPLAIDVKSRLVRGVKESLSGEIRCPALWLCA